MSVYNDDAFSERVSYACLCIIRGTESRHFDTCFEMFDGDAVAVAVYRRSLNNPTLAANIWRRLGQNSVMRAVENLKDVPTSKLHEAARKERAAMHERYK